MVFHLFCEAFSLILPNTPWGDAVMPTPLPLCGSTCTGPRDAAGTNLEWVSESGSDLGMG